MTNPFPGMNPYLEQHWGDVHTRFMVYAGDQLNRQLPDDLRARVEERITVDFDEPESRDVYPDIKVVEYEPSEFGGAPDSVALAEPIVVPVPSERPTARHLEIVDCDGDRVVTAIELLSPANKRGEGRREYRKKQREYRRGDVNLVEIDLLRAGAFVLAVPIEKVPKVCRKPYRICIRRATTPDEAEMYRVSLRAPLPTIAIPLRPHDRDVALQLQSLIDDCYANGRYAGIYRDPPRPPLDEDDARWADELLRQQGLR